MNKIFNVQIRIQGPQNDCRTFKVVARTHKAAMIAALDEIDEADKIAWNCCEISFQVFEANRAFIL